MSAEAAFSPVPGRVPWRLDHVKTSDSEQTVQFDINSPLSAPDMVQATLGIPGWAKLAEVHVPVGAGLFRSIQQAEFQVFGAPEDTPYLHEIQPDVTGGGSLIRRVPAGSLAVIDAASLQEVSRRAMMDPERLAKYLGEIAEMGARDIATPSIDTEYAIPETPSTEVVVGREAAFKHLLYGGYYSLASKRAFSVALGGILRVYARNDTRVIYMR